MRFPAFLHLSVLAVATAVLFVVPGESSAEEEPDVLMIVVDDMNDWVSLLDPDSPVRTPNLERLAARGMTFTRAYCASPACNPDRTAPDDDRGLWKQERLARRVAGSENDLPAVS